MRAPTAGAPCAPLACAAGRLGGVDLQGRERGGARRDAGSRRRRYRDARAVQFFLRSVGRGWRLYAGRDLFLSLSACHANGSFHEVEFVQARLSERWRSISRLIFGLLSLAACTLIAWQFIRLEMSSWRFGGVTPSYLTTPLWLPQLPMALGMIALCFSLCGR